MQVYHLLYRDHNALHADYSTYTFYGYHRSGHMLKYYTKSDNWCDKAEIMTCDVNLY